MDTNTNETYEMETMNEEFAPCAESNELAEADDGTALALAAVGAIGVAAGVFLSNVVVPFARRKWAEFKQRKQDEKDGCVTADFKEVDPDEETERSEDNKDK